jgi:pimeloyl-ACP methyl ester carboxylesterase
VTNDSAGHPHLVFIHGGGVGPWMWRAQRQHAGGAVTVHTPTLPGHDPASDDTYTSHADAARSIAQQVGLDQLGNNVTVIGFSVGGQVAIEVTSMFSEQVARTVVVSSLVKPWRAASLLAQTSAAAAPLARNRRFARLQAKQLYLPDEDFEDYFALTSSMSKASLTNMMTANFSFSPPENFITRSNPVLLVAGSQEQRSLVNGLTDLRDRLPSARFESIDGVGHGAPIAKPAQFNELLDAWLAGQPA